jgi:hypothetical protein
VRGRASISTRKYPTSLDIRSITASATLATGTLSTATRRGHGRVESVQQAHRPGTLSPGRLGAVGLARGQRTPSGHARARWRRFERAVSAKPQSAAGRRGEPACRPGLDPGSVRPGATDTEPDVTCDYDLSGSHHLWLDDDTLCRNVPGVAWASCSQRQLGMRTASAEVCPDLGGGVTDGRGAGAIGSRRGRRGRPRRSRARWPPLPRGISHLGPQRPR